MNGPERIPCRALSLWQPWAQYVACGLKTMETRSWKTSYRGPILIHAAKRRSMIGKVKLDPEDPVCAPYGDRIRTFQEARFPDDAPSRWPLGAYVAVGWLEGCVPTQPETSAFCLLDQMLGNFSPGRFVWMLSSVLEFERPIPAKGRQGLWIPERDLVENVFSGTVYVIRMEWGSGKGTGYLREGGPLSSERLEGLSNSYSEAELPDQLLMTSAPAYARRYPDEKTAWDDLKIIRDSDYAERGFIGMTEIKPVRLRDLLRERWDLCHSVTA